MARKPKLRNSRKTTDFDDKFEAFLKESMSSEDSSLDTGRVAKYLEVQKKKEQPWWMNEVEEDDDDDNDHGLTMTGKNFLKSQKQHVSSVTKPQMERTPACEVRMSRDSLDGDSLHDRLMQKKDNIAGAFVPALSLESSQTGTDTLTADKPEDNRRMGFETMAEQKEKDNFFQALEHESVKTVDYAKLNQELGMSSTVAAAKESSTAQYKVTPTENADRGHQHKNQETKQDQNDQQKKSSMLSKVSLLDSLDSTLGTKPAASREAKDDMQAIPEGVGEQEGEEEGGDGQMRGGTLTDDTDANRGTDTTNRGVTLKTATGCNTDTSREIEALHQALRQVGDATLGSISKDFTFKDSSSKMFHETGGATDGTHSTAAFAMKPVAPPRGGRYDRTVDDVIMEVQQAKRLPELGQVSDMATIAMTTNSVLGKIEEENGGATPKKPLGVHSLYNGDVDLGMSPICNGRDSLDLSLLQKYDDSEGFGFETSTPDRTAESRGRPVPSPANRSGSTAHSLDKKVHRYAYIKSSGYGVASPAKSNPARVTWSMSEAAKQKPKGGMSEKSRSRSAHSPARRSTSKGRMANLETRNLGSVADSRLLQSFTQMLQEHLSSVGTNEDNVIGSIKQLSVERVKALMDEITKWQHQYHEQQKTTLELRANMEAIEHDFECRNDSMKTQYEQEITRLKQQNYVLTAKVEQLQKQLSRRALVVDGGTEAGDESSKLAGMEKELEEQEKLIMGFQTENERLYSELKKLRTTSKEAEGHMFRDNQKLRVDIAMLREELQRKDGQLRNKGLITGSEVQGKIAAGVMATEGTAVLGANRIAQLEVELKQAKLREETYKKEQQAAGETKRQLDLQVDELLRKVRDYEERTRHFVMSQNFEAKEVEVSYKKEIERLNRKIEWYVENQQLLDKDVNVLKEKDNEIRRLKVKLENLQSERGRKEAEVKAQTKQRITEARRIQDLERQVKEMESIVRKRHPNSLPVLMWAAAAAESEGEMKKPPSVKFLEKQMMKLEDELEVKDGEAERSIRVLEQKYNLMKLQYEDRIRELESQLAKCQHPEEGERPHTHSSALQRELDSVRERHKRKVGDLEQEMDRLRKEVMVLKHRETANVRAETKPSKEADVDLQLKVKLLQQDLTNQEREKQLLQRSVQRLMKEKEQLLTECKNTARPASGKDRPKGKLSKVGKKRGVGLREVESEPEPLPAYMDTVTRDKVYLPDTFAGQHVSEILQENEEVKLKVDRLQLELEHQRVYHQKLLAENEARERRIREEADERVNALKSTHQMELNRLLTEHVMHNSASKVAELHNKLDAQEVVVRHLREQMAAAEVDREKLSVLRVRELALETQTSKLQDELHEAKKCHSPEMRHLDALRTKINEMEARHAQRERELQQLLTQSHMNADADIRHEVDKWRHIVEEKNRETETFRIELDAILDVLRELQRQGVVLPCRTLPGR